MVCSLCNSESAITDPESAEIVCTKCGMVISDELMKLDRNSIHYNGKIERVQ